MSRAPSWFTGLLLGEQIPGSLIARLHPPLAPELQEWGTGTLEMKGTALRC